MRAPDVEVCPTEVHERLKADDEWWFALPVIGYQPVDDTEELELRNCPCGSTLARCIAPRSKAVH